jgi:hypothetical protein
MIPPRARWRAAGVAALFLLVTWACNCGTLQGLISPGEEAVFAPTPTIIPTATDAPPTATPTITPTPAPTHTPTPAPTETPAATPTEMGLLFEDDFSDPASGWYVDQDEGGNGSYTYEGGVYAVTALSSGLQMWGPAGRSFGDVVITVDATQVSAPANDNNGYGVGCRIQDDGAGYYLRISGDGYYGAHRVTYDTQGEETFTVLVEWTRTDAINLGNAANHIEATCAGSQLTLTVNGQIVLIAEDDTFTEGDIALTVTTYEDEPTTVHFDNVVVREP